MRKISPTPVSTASITVSAAVLLTPHDKLEAKSVPTTSIESERELVVVVRVQEPAMVCNPSPSAAPALPNKAPDAVSTTTEPATWTLHLAPHNFLLFALRIPEIKPETAPPNAPHPPAAAGQIERHNPDIAPPAIPATTSPPLKAADTPPTIPPTALRTNESINRKLPFTSTYNCGEFRQKA